MKITDRLPKLPPWAFYLLSWTWGLPMTLLGALTAVALLLTGHKCRKWGCCRYFEVGENWGGMELGMFFLVNRGSSEQLRCHEHGHGLQNCLLGPLMPFVVSIPSAVRYWYRELGERRGRKALRAYDAVWFEGQATRLGRDFCRRLRKEANRKIQ